MSVSPGRLRPAVLLGRLRPAVLLGRLRPAVLLGRLRPAVLGALVGVLLASTGAAWAVASPPGSSPDEPLHLASIWCAWGQGPGVCEPTGLANRVLYQVQVPAGVAASPCVSLDPNTTGACLVPALVSGGTGLAAADRGVAPRLYYATMRAFVGPSVAVSVVAMRLVTVLLAALLVGLAVALAGPLLTRAVALAWLASLVPLALFLIASVNPSGWTIVGVGTFWAFLLRAVRGSRAPVPRVGPASPAPRVGPASPAPRVPTDRYETAGIGPDPTDRYGSAGSEGPLEPPPTESEGRAGPEGPAGLEGPLEPAPLEPVPLEPVPLGAGRGGTVVAAVFAVAAAVLAVGSRGDGAAYVVLSVIAVLALEARSWRDLRTRRLLPLVALVGVAVLVAVTTRQVLALTGFGPELEGANRDGLEVLVRNVFGLPELLGGALGYGWGLGALDTPMPAATALTVPAVWFALFVVGASVLWRRKTLVVTGVAAVLVILPLWVLQAKNNIVGENVQPRYLLPLMLVLLGLALLGRVDRPVRLARYPAVLVVLVVAGAQAAALHTTMRRYLFGLDSGAFDLGAGYEWWWDAPVQPMTVFWVGSLAALGLAVALMVAAQSDGRAAPRRDATGTPEGGR